MMRKKSRERGFTLVEVIAGIFIIGTFVLVVTGFFAPLARGLVMSKTRLVVTHLAQEKIDHFKAMPYHRVLPTKQSDIVSYGYDNTYYPPETNLLVGGRHFNRYVLIRKTNESGADLPPDHEDTGMKKITVHIKWTDPKGEKIYTTSTIIKDPERKPPDSKFYGVVRTTFDVVAPFGVNDPIPNAWVVVEENPFYNDFTDERGEYEIHIPPGSWHLSVSSLEYFDVRTTTLTLKEKQFYKHDFTMHKRGLGSAQGDVYKRTHLVISEVCPAYTPTQDGNQPPPPPPPPGGNRCSVCGFHTPYCVGCGRCYPCSISACDRCRRCWYCECRCGSRRIDPIDPSLGWNFGWVPERCKYVNTARVQQSTSLPSNERTTFLARIDTPTPHPSSPSNSLSNERTTVPTCICSCTNLHSSAVNVASRSRRVSILSQLFKRFLSYNPFISRLYAWELAWVEEDPPILPPDPVVYTLRVRSINPDSGVFITVYANWVHHSGITPFDRTYNENTLIQLTASNPAPNGNTFQKWLRNGLDFPGNTDPTVIITMNADYTMTAIYVQPAPVTRTLTVNSLNPNSGVSITVSPVDNNGSASGSTPFQRTYNNNTNVTLTAQQTAPNGNTFQKWQRNNVDFSTNLMVTITMDANYTMTAVYVSQQPPPSQPVDNELFEYIELYNPTTFPITINNSNFKLKYVDSNNVVRQITLNFITNTVPANGGYFLIASTPVVRIPGLGPVSANATYNPSTLNIDSKKRGGICITNNYDVWIDSLAWGASSGNTPPASAVETAGYTFPGSQEGILADRSLERKSDIYSSNPIGRSNLQGNAFDSDNNLHDFGYNPTVSSLSPQNATSIENPHPFSGKLVVGALVFCNDGLSSPVISRLTPRGRYEMGNISTGTWRLDASYAGLSGTRTVVITDGAVTFNQHIILNQVSVHGHITGRVVSGGRGLAGITVRAGITEIVTDRLGFYRLSLSPGEYIVTANPGNLNPNFTSESTTYNVKVEIGRLVRGVNFILHPGGRIVGRIVNQNNDPFPHVIVEARVGHRLWRGISGLNGYFTISNLRNLTYTVKPVLEMSETSDPGEVSVTVQQGQPVWSSTFVIINVMGKFQGNVEYKGEKITTGVIIIASTSTALSPITPPAITSKEVGIPPYYFMTTSNEKGTYELPVIGYGDSQKYRIIAWYTYLEGNRPVTRYKQAVGVTVSPGCSKKVDFTGTDWELIN